MKKKEGFEKSMDIIVFGMRDFDQKSRGAPVTSEGFKKNIQAFLFASFCWFNPIKTDEESQYLK